MGKAKKRTKLIAMRNKLKLTHEEVAREANISRSYYGFIEQGIRNPTFEKAKSIANVFKKPIEEVFPDEFFFAGKCYFKKHQAC